MGATRARRLELEWPDEAISKMAAGCMAAPGFPRGRWQHRWTPRSFNGPPRTTAGGGNPAEQSAGAPRGPGWSISLAPGRFFAGERARPRPSRGRVPAVGRPARAGQRVVVAV